MGEILNCAHFRTDISFLETHKAELREAERVIAKASANGWARQIEMNERKRNNLISIFEVWLPKEWYQRRGYIARRNCVRVLCVHARR
jgi:hypothetical protein